MARSTPWYWSVMCGVLEHHGSAGVREDVRVAGCVDGCPMLQGLVSGGRDCSLVERSVWAVHWVIGLLQLRERISGASWWPVVKMSRFHCGKHRFSPCQETRSHMPGSAAEKRKETVTAP